MSPRPDTVDDMSVALDHTELPTLRVGVAALYCSGPRRDGRFGLHRVSPSEPPFAYAWEDGDEWVWEAVDADRRGTAASLVDCLAAAHDG